MYFQYIIPGLKTSYLKKKCCVNFRHLFHLKQNPKRILQELLTKLEPRDGQLILQLLNIVLAAHMAVVDFLTGISTHTIHV